MSQNVKKIETKLKNQVTRDIESIMDNAKKKDMDDNEEGLESEEERIKYIKEDLGLE